LGCEPVLDGIPAMACGLPVVLLSVGLLRLGGCMMKKTHGSPFGGEYE